MGPGPKFWTQFSKRGPVCWIRDPVCWIRDPVCSKRDPKWDPNLGSQIWQCWRFWIPVKDAHRSHSPNPAARVENGAIWCKLRPKTIWAAGGRAGGGNAPQGLMFAARTRDPGRTLVKLCILKFMFDLHQVGPSFFVTRLWTNS